MSSFRSGGEGDVRGLVVWRKLELDPAAVAAEGLSQGVGADRLLAPRAIDGHHLGVPHGWFVDPHIRPSP